MANYNTFLLVDTKTRRPLLVTSSARKVTAELCKGRRIEVWNENERIDVIYANKAESMRRFIQAEKEYIRHKQERAEFENTYRRLLRT